MMDLSVVIAIRISVSGTRENLEANCSCCSRRCYVGRVEALAFSWLYKSLPH